jgi:hypothetical protein
MAWWLASLPKESTTGLVSATASDRRDLNFDLNIRTYENMAISSKENVI